ncbi:MAG: penicillin-binding protein 2 [Elusimicrobia bacterium]|nr:penicillin-binding protein 2 [Elusimicrobiota bacterium]MBK7207271.1 penicillin-binding protein 2 [Elusimicrobiota bacterium]MBK7546084.1 penicillin-binding protein 2 [Elusimicrobiota bacterium]MBK7575431.1 penicillin-binding protein 2 [Elusimicrobiota bacterium]MBK7689143.1 penicillin-binding protein 2 [Elusimicrobiota bacterium]
MNNRENAPLSARDDRRLFVLSTLATGVFVLLALRLFFLQVVRGPEFSRRAERNSTQLLPFLAPRGLIYAQTDGKDDALLDNAPRFSLFYARGGDTVFTPEAVLAELVRRLPDQRTALQRKMAEAQRTGKMTRLLANIPRESALAIMERRAFLPGVNVLAEPQRRTRYGSLAAHLLGYVSEVDDNDLKRDRDRWRSGQFIGRGGVEKVYDDLLRGTDGGLQFVTDAAGRHIQVLGRLSSVPGADLHLTLDRRLQQVAEAGLDASPSGRGAAVVLDPRTGAVLTLASRPGFDPSESLARHVIDPRQPFFNRALQGVYPPGSVFKIITALTGLNDARWDTHRTFYCNGVYLLPITGGVREFKCWNKHHRQDFWGAVAWSCNIYFYNIGLTAGPEALASRAKAFGFGEKTGIDLPSESSGLMPDREWKKRARREGWFDGDTLNTAIGQGFVLSTPLQAAVFVAAVANGGTVWKPYLVREARATTGQTLWRGKSEIRRTVELNNATWGTLHRAMGNVVSQGSGRVIYRPDLDLGAKTGTAQNPHGEDHAWFAAYAGPKGQPAEIAVLVFVENGGHGSAAAGPIAKRIIDTAFPPGRV